MGCAVTPAAIWDRLARLLSLALREGLVAGSVAAVVMVALFVALFAVRSPTAKPTAGALESGTADSGGICASLAGAERAGSGGASAMDRNTCPNPSPEVDVTGVDVDLTGIVPTNEAIAEAAGKCLVSWYGRLPLIERVIT
jgi:hypothetical protein